MLLEDREVLDEPMTRKVVVVVDTSLTFDQTMFDSLEPLRTSVRAGKKYSYVLFWGHRPRFPHGVDASCLSQWFRAGFQLDGFNYSDCGTLHDGGEGTRLW